MNKSNLILKQISVGPMGNYSYFVGDSATKEVAVVDPGWGADSLKKIVKDNGWTITAVLLTHGHYDHVNAIADLLGGQNIPIYISTHESPIYMPKLKNIKRVAPNEKIKIGNVEITCLHTPGHSQGCQCFLVEGNLITGDTLFVEGCGRVDLPGGNAKALYHSLYNVILKLPDETMIYSGHDYGRKPFATLKEVKEINPYLQCVNEEDFLHGRLGW